MRSLARIRSLGLAVLSESTIQGELANGELAALPVRGFPLRHKWHLVYPEGKQLAPAAKVFAEYLVMHCRSGGLF